MKTFVAMDKQREIEQEKQRRERLEAEEEDPSYRTVLLTTFVIRKKRCRVYFHRGALIWETERSPYRRWTLSLTDVLTASFSNDRNSGGTINETFRYRERDSIGSNSSPSTNGSTNGALGFVLHYAARGSKNKLSHHSVTMKHDDPRQVASWVKTLRNYITNLRHRPRKILLFVNPFGGKKKGLEIWEKRVQPLMNLAGVEAKVIVTERAGHIHDYLMSCELGSYHAVVCIGGDGTFSELFNGLISRTARDRCIDLNEPDVDLPRPDIPVGMIPSGSTDTLAYSLHGTTDVETAVLHILFGDTTGLDVSSVHSDRELLKIYASIFSYGYLGDVIRDSEKFRWMGPQRYDYSGFKKIIANKGYEGEVELLPETVHPAACTRCTKNCSRCDFRMHNADRTDDIPNTLTVKGKFFMVNGANISCACSKSPMGFSPHCHIGDGCVDVIIVRHTSLFNNIRMLLRLTSKEKTLYDLPFVEVYRAREFTFRATSSEPSETTSSSFESCVEAVEASNGERSEGSLGPGSRLGSSAISVWNCDGEVVDASSVRIRVHRQLLKVFTRRMQAPAPKGTSCFCLL
ncbi:hypothetical protein QAD02_019250 [Eretmocerus hayati]|uniref:Uncharacterized protein n=1 Tax=Eretmocerus hayati TaxID=131215 RepID=A0ACC2PK84_9HYME|nr:hypothetical protein QAD02_019250 [Eretmocerus hayati]